MYADVSSVLCVLSMYFTYGQCTWRWNCAQSTRSAVMLCLAVFLTRIIFTVSVPAVPLAADVPAQCRAHGTQCRAHGTQCRAYGTQCRAYGTQYRTYGTQQHRDHIRTPCTNHCYFLRT